MKENSKEIPISLKYKPNDSKIIEHSKEDIINNSDDNQNSIIKKVLKKDEKNNNKHSKVYFYCPYNRTYTKFQNYEINKICDLIKKYVLENYFIIQIDNDNNLYEEILKMQFKNESQIIHKMFDLKLDYSFSPFQDSLFFNMSILTDFFYDQIEKYLIQIFFHNHGIYIINKDSCDSIHQIIMEKFIFYFVENSEFFDKSITDKYNKNKSTKMLINDFKLKKIIQKIQLMETTKSNKKNSSVNKNQSAAKSYKKNRYSKDTSNYQNRSNTSDNNNNNNRSSKSEKNRNKKKLNFRNKNSNSFREDKTFLNKRKDEKLNKNDDNLISLSNVKIDMKENMQDSLNKRTISYVENKKSSYNLFDNNNNDSNNKNCDNAVKRNNSVNQVKNSNNDSDSNKISSEYNCENSNINYNHKNSGNALSIIDKKDCRRDLKNGVCEISNSIDKDYFGVESYRDLLEKPDENDYNNDKTKFYKDISKDINNQILNELCDSSMSSKTIIEQNKIFNEIDNKHGRNIHYKEKNDFLQILESKNTKNKKLKNFKNLKNEINIKDNFIIDENESNNYDSEVLQNKITEEGNKIRIDSTSGPILEKIINDKTSKNNNINIREDIIKRKPIENYNQNLNVFMKLSVTNSTKDKDPSPEKIGNNLNKSHNNIAKHSEDKMDSKNNLNLISAFHEKRERQNSNLNEINKIYLQENLNSFQEMDTFNHKHEKNTDEYRLLNNSKQDENNINNINNEFQYMESLVKKNSNERKNRFEDDNIKKKDSYTTPNKRINFSTDELIYYLFIVSLEKLEEFTESLVKEVDSLKGIYLELSEKERKDFFKRIHSLEVSMHIIHQETKIKMKFFKFAKNQFRSYNKLSNDFYFKNNFNFFLELMISKITQIELQFDTLENFLKMIKENYHIIIEDNTEKQNVKLNNVMKVLTVLTTIYAPMNIVLGLFGMNVKVPWEGTDFKTINPFIGICGLLMFIILIQLWIFRKLKWF
jgi:Mg2+ and Co2+ transporter CorA